jgi:hypothetical protein
VSRKLNLHDGRSGAVAFRTTKRLRVIEAHPSRGEDERERERGGENPMRMENPEENPFSSRLLGLRVGLLSHHHKNFLVTIPRKDPPPLSALKYK